MTKQQYDQAVTQAENRYNNLRKQAECGVVDYDLMVELGEAKFALQVSGDPQRFLQLVA